MPEAVTQHRHRHELLEQLMPVAMLGDGLGHGHDRDEPLDVVPATQAGGGGEAPITPAPVEGDGRVGEGTTTAAGGSGGPTARGPGPSERATKVTGSTAIVPTNEAHREARKNHAAKNPSADGASDGPRHSQAQKNRDRDGPDDHPGGPDGSRDPEAPQGKPPQPLPAPKGDEGASVMAATAHVAASDGATAPRLVRDNNQGSDAHRRNKENQEKQTTKEAFMPPRPPDDPGPEDDELDQPATTLARFRMSTAKG